MLELVRLVDVGMGLVMFRIVWVSGQFTQFPPETRWDGDRRALNARMGWLMFIALGLTLVAAATLAASAVAGRSYPSLLPWVHGVTLLLVLLAWPLWREVARGRAAVELMRRYS